jgi:PAS domain S-box-containing protein
LQAEDALRLAEIRYRTIFEQARDGILIVDPVTRRFVEFNTVAHEQLGYDAEEFAGLTISDIEVEESPEDTVRHVELIRKRGWDNFETRHRRKDGAIRDVQVIVQLMTIDGLPMLHCSFRDITERKQAETAIKTSEESSKAVISRLERDKEYTPEGSSSRKDLESQIAAARAEHESNMNMEKAKIDNARAEVTRIQGLMKGGDEAVAAAETRHKKALADDEAFNKKAAAEAEAEVKRKYPNIDMTTEDIAAQHANARAMNLFGHGVKEENDHLVSLAKKFVTESKEDRALKRMIDKSLKENKEEKASEEEKPAADH